ncbi:uncharacterized protein L969DRAFT_42785 [Mixia osmundae IAM 14324]|uniref:CBF1-interacting co-repressor CIR N-terminal domain-containing protein n=1 Tax=Mixia osmundae (strain CBS 9802 / IAM 14324 / JCM 22182 / KY 12970) TaxID=764103 RepID=G7DT27_MIXOS|nr:uncharacterized protein L969DRAFT_42785 [Mixia osmundae IAM 14324]KEI42760.1 hypothetical protein L969DRAFT_42785 [Mixia osmundae IAM 14324]GAA93906.1 hypothetical protein E5Q_00552 [Mixia osmundae IAM 14324]
MGKLNIAHHKSYHPYRRDNIERVQRDEEAARLKEAGEEQRMLLAKAKGKAKEREPGLEALERQLAGKSDQPDETARVTIVRPEAEAAKQSSIDTDGHLNFWADLERGGTLPAQLGNNPRREADKRKEQEKWDAQTTMYLGRPAKELQPWYTTKDLLSGEERRRTDEQKLELAYKDGESKRTSDPLSLVNHFLQRRDEIIAAKEQAKQDPFGTTARSLKPGLLEMPLLRPKQRGRTRRSSVSPSPPASRAKPADPDGDENEDAYAPAPPPPKPLARQDQQSEASRREKAERERAMALIQAKTGRSVTSTPASERGYSDQWNKLETRLAKNVQARRWNDEDRERRQAWDTSARYNDRRR